MSDDTKVRLEQAEKNNKLMYIALLGITAFAFYLFGKEAGSKNIATTATTAGTQQAAAAQQAPKVTQNQIKALFSKDNITFGNPNAKLLLVEVSDPSCPYCHIASGKNAPLAKQGGQFQYVTDGGSYVPPVPEFKKLVDAGKAAMVVIYSNGHGNGEFAQQALFCANEKGKYWEAHDLIYSAKGYDLLNKVEGGKHSKLSSRNEPAVVKPEAPQLMATFLAPAVDQNFMKDCLSTGKYKNSIGANQKLASALGVQGTPGFFVNTTNFAGAYSYTDMQSAVDAAMK